MATSPSGNSKNDRKSKNKSAATLRREARAHALAEECYESAEFNDSPEARIWAYYGIGKALRQLARFKHGNKYDEDLVGVFTSKWEEKGGFRFGTGQAKYFRLFAAAFHRRLLKKALNAGISWSSLRELSRSGVTPELRRNIVDGLSAGKREAKKAREAIAHLDEQPGYEPTLRAPTAADTARRCIRMAERAAVEPYDYILCAEAWLEHVEGGAEEFARCMDLAVERAGSARDKACCADAWAQTDLPHCMTQVRRCLADAFRLIRSAGEFRQISEFLSGIPAQATLGGTAVWGGEKGLTPIIAACQWAGGARDRNSLEKLKAKLIHAVEIACYRPHWEWISQAVLFMVTIAEEHGQTASRPK